MDYYQYYEGDFSGDHHTRHHQSSHYYEPATSTIYRAMSPKFADDRICAVCASPNASTMHFGGRSCKACAAFFRRTVSMQMKYKCIGTERSCRIHFELRMLCRHCRYVACLEAGMRMDLVRRKREEKTMKKRSKDLIYDEDPEQNDEFQNYFVQDGTTYMTETTPPLSVPSPKSENDEHIVVDLDQSSVLGKEEFPRTIPRIYTTLPSTSTANTEVFYEPEVFYNPGRRNFDDWYLRRGQSIEPEDDAIFKLINQVIKMETGLNDRRKVMYTDTPIRDFFEVVCECPYNRKDLKMFDFRTFTGMVKQDFQMILDYVKGVPEFDQLNGVEKNIMYRMTCAVDSIISSAYYTYRLGMDEKILVLLNGNYIPMDPEPLSGTEPEAGTLFDSEEDLVKYKTLMPVKIQQWHTMAVPFSRLNITFEEFVLLKLLTIWHVSNYKLGSEGRKVCARQRDQLLAAMHRVCVEKGESNPGERVGQLILSMSCIIEQAQTLTTSYVMITFFDVIGCDPLMHDVVSFKDEHLRVPEACQKTAT